jgi:hypothetical protein
MKRFGQMRSLLFIALLALAPAAHADNNAPAPAAKPAATADGDKLICRRETVIGSNIPGKRVCKPRSEIIAEQAAAREAAREISTPQGSASSNN